MKLLYVTAALLLLAGCAAQQQTLNESDAFNTAGVDTWKVQQDVTSDGTVYIKDVDVRIGRDKSNIRLEVEFPNDGPIIRYTATDASGVDPLIVQSRLREALGKIDGEVNQAIIKQVTDSVLKGFAVDAVLPTQ